MKNLATTALAALIASSALVSAESLQNHPTPAGGADALRVFGHSGSNIECYLPIRADGEIAGPGDDVAYWNNRSIAPNGLGRSAREETEFGLGFRSTVDTRDRSVSVNEIEYGVANGEEYSRDNLTSMGVSSTTGQHVLRIRSASNNNPVTIRQAGGGVVFSGTVGAGDTFVQVGGPGTYIAQTGSRTITKATGPQTFTDRTETRQAVVDELRRFPDEPTVNGELEDCSDIVARLRAAGWN